MDNVKDIIKHHGVKGMKWGVRNDERMSRASRQRNNAYSKGMKMQDTYKLKRITSSNERKKYIDDKDQKWLDKVDNDANIRKVNKRTAKDMRKVNKELKKEYGSSAKRVFNREANAKFNSEMKSAYESILADNTFAVYKMSPSRTREVRIKSMSDGTLKAVVSERNNAKLSKQRTSIAKSAERRLKKEQSLNHSALDDSFENLNGMFFIISTDADGFPDEVYSAFEEDVQHRDTKDIIKHHGVKGMKWGVRRDDRTSVGEKVKSLKRERQWGKVLSEVDNLTNDEISQLSKRVSMENSLKKLVRESDVATKTDKADYIRRDQLDDDALNEKIVRLRTKDTLSKAVSSASKEQRELGEKVVNTAGAIAMTYATTKTLTPKDLIDAYTNNKPLKDRVKDKVVKELIESVTRPN